ncbi:hypothetical protein EOD39_4962 [Acipenser ruthenus]|uniref:Uncharacterized protein n=1 Tax=Acipenser ruthenus TaxID=7906 RepID=A0A444UG03_ACIRT|nr:hypothetical protein EOD39_4962 [Acipenser ruthenus]
MRSKWSTGSTFSNNMEEFQTGEETTFVVDEISTIIKEVRRRLCCPLLAKSYKNVAAVYCFVVLLRISAPPSNEHLTAAFS